MGQQCFISHFLTNAEKKSFMMKKTNRLRRLVVDDHYDHDDFDAVRCCAMALHEATHARKADRGVPDKMMDMQRPEPILEAKNNSRSA